MFLTKTYIYFLQILLLIMKTNKLDFSKKIYKKILNITFLIVTTYK